MQLGDVKVRGEGWKGICRAIWVISIGVYSDEKIGVREGGRCTGR